jgi:DNA-binding PadR family transcriptional regulator
MRTRHRRPRDESEPHRDHQHRDRHHRGEGPFRLRHGDVRVALLIALEDGPAHGYELGQRLADRTKGAWRPSPGSIYPTLQALSDEDCITSEERGGKRIHTLTDKGRTELREREKRGEPPPWEGADHSGTGDLREAVVAVKSAARQISSVGKPEQIAEATRIVLDARRQLYELLAKGDK